MAQALYSVIFSGKLREGYARNAVEKGLVRLFRRGPLEIQRLMSGGRHVVKTLESREKAEQLVTLLAEVGAVALIEERRLRTPKAKKPRGVRLKASMPRPAGCGFLYRLRLSLATLWVAAAAALFPALMLLIAAGVIYIGNGPAWLGTNLPNPLLALLVQFTLTLLGFTAIVALFKPVLRLKHIDEFTVPLERGDAADLMTLIDYLCSAVDAPRPVRILLTLEPRVEARYERGFGALLRNAVVLRIGMPLLAAVSARELAGLIAAALAEHSYGTAPRRAAFVAGINRLLSRAVVSRDSADLKLQQWTDSDNRLLSRLARPLQRLTASTTEEVVALRRIVRALSRRVIRERTLYADRCYGHIAGSEGFGQTLHTVDQLNGATAELLPRLREIWQEQHRLYARLPQALAKRAVGSDGLADDTLPLPAIAARLEAAVETQGLLSGESPASTLLPGFSELCRRQSFLYYRRYLKLPVSGHRLISAEEFDGKVMARPAEEAAVEAFFFGVYDPLLPLAIDPSGTAAAPQAIAARLKEKAGGALRVFRAYHALEGQTLDALLAEQLLLAGVSFNADDYGVPSARLEAVQALCRKQELELERLQEGLEAFVHMVGKRLAAAIALLDTPQAPPPLATEARHLMRVLGRTDTLLPQLHELRTQTTLLEPLLATQRGGRSRGLEDRIRERTADINRLLTGLRVGLKNTPYPFPTQGRTPSLLDYVMPGPPAAELPPHQALDQGLAVFERLFDIHRQVLNRVITLALQAERAGAR